MKYNYHIKARVEYRDEEMGKVAEIWEIHKEMPYVISAPCHIRFMNLEIMVNHPTFIFDYNNTIEIEGYCYIDSDLEGKKYFEKLRKTLKVVGFEYVRTRNR